MQGAAAMVAGAPTEQVAVCSTGVIGVQLDGQMVTKGLLAARPELRVDGALDFADAIRTTDIARQAGRARRRRCRAAPCASPRRPRARG